jgi:membrane protein implicated in regulation of membrane protease activity
VSTLFWICALVGGGFILLQAVLGLLGLGDHALGESLDDGHGGEVHAGDALNLLSVRAIAAGLCFFGLTGLAAGEWGLGSALGLPVAVAAGLAAVLAVALAMRAMRRMETDGVLRPEGAVGHTATVYLRIPGGPGAPGKVHLVLQGRTVEMLAVSRDPLPTGAPVVVVDVVSPDTLEVAPQPQLGVLADV